jgi:hypothetical protein
MKINNSSKSFFILFFLIFFIKNNVASELAMGMFEKIKNKTSLLAAPSMQLSFMKYNNLLTLYLGQQLFNTSKVQDLIKIQDLVDSDEIVENKRKMRSYLCLFRINNNFENYFTQNLKEKKYINFFN